MTSGEKQAKQGAATGRRSALSGATGALSTAEGRHGAVDESGQTQRFALSLIAWQKTRGRHDLPWQNTRDAYRIWLSEIMLQQTQVSSVIPYYLRFVQRFPDVGSLAAAPLEDVLTLWSGLGYYARARNLHACACQVQTRFGGHFPTDLEQLIQLPGIGRSTAAAIAVFSCSTQVAILDGNVKRILARCFGIPGFPGSASVGRDLWALAEQLVPESSVEAYTQGLMDLGATVCARSKPRCIDCPLAALCIARREGRTAELPAARPRKAVPLRQSHVVLLLHQGQVLLFERPPAGLWGGLWTLPEIPDGSSADAVAQQLGCEVADWKVMAPLRRAFTHFRLDLTAHCGRVARIRVSAAREPGPYRWLALDAVDNAPLPTPVIKLLRQLQSN